MGTLLYHIKQIGYAAGAVVSLLFKRKAMIRCIGAGFGGGYQLSENTNLLPK
jgi:hypothetical protein